MAELSDGFIAPPGGIGTLEETFKIWTRTQLGHHVKPCALLSVEGYNDGLNSFLYTVSSEGSLKDEHRKMLISESDPRTLLTTMRAYVAPPVGGKWIRRTIPTRSKVICRFDQIACALADHDTGSHRVASCDSRHDGTVRNTELLNAINSELPINDRHRILPHLACAGLMPYGAGTVAKVILHSNILRDFRRGKFTIHVGTRHG